jgi:hypothetical protein
MAKKSKRRTTSYTPASKAPQAEAQRPAAAINGKGYGITGFNPDYSPVKKDLIRIAVLAGSFFVILVVLTFFLR